MTVFEWSGGDVTQRSAKRQKGNLPSRVAGRRVLQQEYVAIVVPFALTAPVTQMCGGGSQAQKGKSVHLASACRKEGGLLVAGRTAEDPTQRSAQLGKQKWVRLLQQPVSE